MLYERAMSTAWGTQISPINQLAFGNTMTLTQKERDSIATICLMAAFADGKKDESERARLKKIFEDMDSGFSPALYSDVLLGKVQLTDMTLRLTNPLARMLAYEMAVGVCDADGQMGPEERSFLQRLQESLDLDMQLAQDFSADAEDLAAMPLADGLPGSDTLPGSDNVSEPGHTSSFGKTGYSASEPPPALREDPSIDPLILKFAVLNGGLELLPQSLASMAIVPLQMKMVYQIGAKYGYQLDQGHIKDFLAVVGVGMTSQVLETYARKLVGGFMKKAIGKKKGKKLGKVAGAATGMAMSFATTYALGHVARVYYARGRELTPDALKRLFSERVEQGKLLVDTYRSDIESSARNTDLNSILSMVRKPVG